MNPNRHLICGACGARLPSMKLQNLLRDRDSAAQLADESSLMSDGDKKQRKVKTEFQNKLEKVMKIQLLSYSRVEGDLLDATGVSLLPPGTVPVERVVLPLVHLNPGVHENQKLITSSFCNCC